MGSLVVASRNVGSFLRIILWGQIQWWSNKFYITRVLIHAFVIKSKLNITNAEKTMVLVLYESTAEEVSFQLSHRKIRATVAEVRLTLQDCRHHPALWVCE